MGGALFLVIVIPVIILILLVAIFSKSSSNQQVLDSIKKKLSHLGSQLNDMEARINELKTDLEINRHAEIKKDTGPIKSPTVSETTILTKTEKPIIEKQIIEPGKIIPPLHEEVIENKTLDKSFSETPEEVFQSDELSETQTDWEKFIGENLANKIGIAVLVLGISFFVKFAIDKNWINETGRVIIGLVSGAVLISLAHYIRNTYRSFSSVLVGGGLTVFYFTIAFAFHQYHLISQESAFIIMIIITAIAVLLSIFYNRVELAVLATIGGFITPFLVNTGQNNYVALFTYLCILNTGLLVLSWFKRWKAINIIALFFTIIIYGSWLFRQLYDFSEPFPYHWALFFATFFYILFITMNIINNLKLKIKFGGFDFILLLTINFLYYVAGIIILEYWNDGAYKGLFTGLLGVANLLPALIFLKIKQVDRNFVNLLIGLTLTFVSLTGPVELKGNNITLFWAAEAVVLFWLYQRSRIVLLKITSLIVVLLFVVSLFMDWANIYSGASDILPVIVNKGFVTTLVTAIAMLIYYRLMFYEADLLYLPGIENRHVRNFLLIGGIILTYAAGAWEIYFQFKSRLPDTFIYAAYLQLYSFAFIIILLFIFKRSSSFVLLKFLLTITAMVLYIYNIRINYSISVQMLSTGNYRPHFLMHWLSAVLLAWLLFDMTMYFRKQERIRKDYEIPFTWIMAGGLIFLLSVEMYHVIIWATYSNAATWEYWENLYYKAGLSILWGLSSFIMMWLGMKYQFKTLRIISLTLFTITLVKLFLYDIQNIPPGGKIAAFILLGVLLLIVSFMYQRLKRIIIDDSEKKK